ncbi:hypothetical protein C8R45DRAFT_496367 [Mycena sanguinolenta]|nr:hypothetical protein C8R45DRAFT_496367 [Mycena sanguinolenta]
MLSLFLADGHILGNDRHPSHNRDIEMPTAIPTSCSVLGGRINGRLCAQLSSRLTRKSNAILSTTECQLSLQRCFMTHSPLRINRSLYSSFGYTFFSCLFATFFSISIACTMFRIFAFLPIFSVAAHTLNPLYARQNVSASDASDCGSVCATLSDSISAASSGGLAAVCSSTVVTNYANCYSCNVKLLGMTQADAQQAVDGFVNGCKAGGHPVTGVTINADGSVSGASGSTSTASGGSNSSGKTGAAAQTSVSILGVASALIVAFGMVM